MLLARRVAVATALLLLATSQGSATAGGMRDVTVGDSFFEPETLVVEAGTTVRWTDEGNLAHSVTADDGSFDSHPGCTPDVPTSCMQSGQTFSQAFTEPGVVPYYCKIHGGRGGAGMSGVVKVVDEIGAYPRPGETEIVSRTADGAAAGGYADFPDLSSDGRYVSFMSDATSLVPGDGNETTDIFVLDRSTGEVNRATVSSTGEEANGMSSISYISATGRYVIFWSSADNLSPEDDNPYSDVFLRDLQTGHTEVISVSSNEDPSDNISFPGAVTPDGRYVAFDSFGSLVLADTNDRSDVFVRDRELGTTERVSVNDNETERGGDSNSPDITPDGRFVSFTSLIYSLAQNENQYSQTNDSMDVFVRDRQAGTTRLVSVALDGGHGNAFSNSSEISDDGRYVAFFSLASNLVPADANRAGDVFVRDVVDGTTKRVSVSSAGEEANGASTSASISDDGRYVAFVSSASNLVPGDTNGASDVFVRDRLLGTTERVSLGSTGSQLNLASSGASISGDGRIVGFTSYEDGVVPGDANGERDVFVHDRGPPTGPGRLDASRNGSEIAASGWATFSGAPLSSAADDPADAGDAARELGAELTGASITHRAEQADLLLRFGVKQLPGVRQPNYFGSALVCPLTGVCIVGAAGAPGVLDTLSFRMDGVPYEVRVARAGSGAPPSAPAAALFRCAPSCVEVSRLTSSYGTSGVEVETVLPLDGLGTPIPALTAVQARTGLGEIATGITQGLDAMTLPDSVVASSRVDLTLYWANTAVAQAHATVDDGRFSGSLEPSSLPAGDYRVDATACLGSMCSTRSAHIEVS